MPHISSFRPVSLSLLPLQVERYMQPTSPALSLTMLLEQGVPITSSRTYTRTVPATLGMTGYQ